MIKIMSISDSLDFYEAWDKTITNFGVIYRCPKDLGEGCVEIIGNVDKAFVVKTDYRLNHSNIIRAYNTEKLIALAEIQGDPLNYYVRKDDIMEIDKGVVCTIQSVPTLLYSHFPVNINVASTGIVIRESLIKEMHLLNEDKLFEKLAYFLNGSNLYSYEILRILKFISSLSPNDEIEPKLIEEMMKNITKILIQQVNHRINEDTSLVFHLEIICNVKNYIDDHFIEDPNVNELCRLFFINKNILQKGFKKITGLSVRDYVIYQKVNKSIELLTTTNLRIDEIAKEVGYQSKPSFYKAFKKVLGVTPANYRSSII